MKNSGKTFVYLLSMLAAAAATVFCGVLWCNNLICALYWHWQLAAGRTDAVPQGIAALQWSVVDVSTVTTFIPFFGFLLILIGIFRISSRENWPFFAGYERLNIALGLIGTLWGIILIGYYPADQVSIPALMNCLHTAMFSTVAAIVWVMIAEPLLLLPWLRALRRSRCESETAPEEATLAECAELLSSAMSRAAAEMNASGRAAAGLHEEWEKIADALKERRAAEACWRREITETVSSLVKTVSSCREIIDRIDARNQEVEAKQQKTAAENADLTRRNTVLERDTEQLASELSQAKAALAESRRRLEAVRGALEQK